ncbi:MAG: glycosyltransferase [Microbacterium sp.]|uniref:CDP-glycerol glycerophosphotransferase family protein n=1 Tax=Microbacterium sp. TaxID=51671 RepID=UPI0039E4781B
MGVLSKARRRTKQLTRAARSEYIAYCRRRPVDNRVVLYESFAGNGALCNPEALFRAALGASDLGHLHHVWSLDDPERHPEFVAEFEGHPRVRFVTRGGRDYWMALSTAGTVVNNATFPIDFAKRPGQVYVNTWHGTPLKRMGFDMPNGAVESANTIRNFLAADILLSQSATMTDQMYRDAYRLGGIHSGRVLEVGYPRVDRQRPSDQQRADALRRLAADIPGIGERALVMYAPTWRGDSFQNPRDDADKLVTDVAELQERLGDEFLVVLKTHQVVHRLAAGDPRFAGRLVSNDLPTNLLLALTDVLVTDYSSIFFDYLATGGPIAFYTPAVDDYESGRGLYRPPSELPGPVVSDVAALAEQIGGLVAGDDEWAARREQWRAQYTPDDDGGASSRVLDVVFRGLDLPGRIRRLDQQRDKRRILIHLGGMRSNGITTSALNLLSAIDYDAYDVTTIHERPKSAQQWLNHARLDPRARRLVRYGGMNGSKLSHAVRRLDTHRERVHLHTVRPGQRTLWDDEWERCFGDARFDVVVDFSGYSPFWALLALHSPGALRAIWLHNDLAAEAHRPVGRRRPMRRSLDAIGRLYREFDRAVSVSAQLNEINRRSFEGPDDDGRFVAARNLMDPTIIERAHREDSLDPGTEAWVQRLRGDGENFWFVSVGRFSAEKNQERMLRAFARVQRERPATRLLLVGYGPMQERLEKLIAELGLEDRAFVFGPVPDPSPIMLHAGGFVLSSDWEGQPMVLLEAAALGLPIVTVAFGSAQNALHDGAMRIVESTDEALAEGMVALADGDVPAASLDIPSYNAEAVAEFYAAISP